MLASSTRMLFARVQVLSEYHNLLMADVLIQNKFLLEEYYYTFLFVRIYLVKIVNDINKCLNLLDVCVNVR